MKGCSNNLSKLLLISVWVVATVLISLTPMEPMAEETRKGQEQPIVIKAKSLELDEAHNIITFKGSVTAESKDFIIKCREMVIYYVSHKGEKDKAGLGTKIDKIIAKGSVHIQRQQGGVATSEEAVYFWTEDKLVLTGNPKVNQGQDFVKGHKITLYLKENRSVVESSGDETVKAVIFPKEAKKP